MALRSANRKPLQNYSQVQVNTAGPGKRVVMMYDGILKNLRLAKNHMQALTPDNIEQAHNAIQLSQKLILELQLALDHDNGGEISSTLDGLYAFWLDHLSSANIEKDTKKIDQVISMAKELRDTWDEAVKEARKQGII